MDINSTITFLSLGIETICQFFLSLASGIAGSVFFLVMAFCVTLIPFLICAYICIKCGCCENLFGLLFAFYCVIATSAIAAVILIIGFVFGLGYAHDLGNLTFGF